MLKYIIAMLFISTSALAADIYENKSGTPIKDFSASSYKIESNIIYTTKTGTPIKDFSSSSYKIENSNTYQIKSGTPIKDFSTPSYKIEKELQ